MSRVIYSHEIGPHFVDFFNRLKAEEGHESSLLTGFRNFLLRSDFHKDYRKGKFADLTRALFRSHPEIITILFGEKTLQAMPQKRIGEIIRKVSSRLESTYIGGKPKPNFPLVLESPGSDPFNDREPYVGWAANLLFRMEVIKKLLTEVSTQVNQTDTSGLRDEIALHFNYLLGNATTVWKRETPAELLGKIWEFASKYDEDFEARFARIVIEHPLKAKEKWAHYSSWFQSSGLEESESRRYELTPLAKERIRSELKQALLNLLTRKELPQLQKIHGTLSELKEIGVEVEGLMDESSAKQLIERYGIDFSGLHFVGDIENNPIGYLMYHSGNYEIIRAKNYSWVNVDRTASEMRDIIAAQIVEFLCPELTRVPEDFDYAGQWEAYKKERLYDHKEKLAKMRADPIEWHPNIAVFSRAFDHVFSRQEKWDWLIKHGIGVEFLQLAGFTPSDLFPDETNELFSRTLQNKVPGAKEEILRVMDEYYEKSDRQRYHHDPLLWGDEHGSDANESGIHHVLGHLVDRSSLSVFFDLLNRLLSQDAAVSLQRTLREYLSVAKGTDTLMRDPLIKIYQEYLGDKSNWPEIKNQLDALSDKELRVISAFFVESEVSQNYLNFVFSSMRFNPRDQSVAWDEKESKLHEQVLQMPTLGNSLLLKRLLETPPNNLACKDLLYNITTFVGDGMRFGRISLKQEGGRHHRQAERIANALNGSGSYSEMPISLVAANHHQKMVYSSKAVSTRDNFLDHREYQPGDDIRDLNWKVWARTDRHYVKTYSGVNDNSEFNYIVDVAWLASFEDGDEQAPWKRIQDLISFIYGNLNKRKQNLHLFYRGQVLVSLKNEELRSLFSQGVIEDEFGKRTTFEDFLLELFIVADIASLGRQMLFPRQQSAPHGSPMHYFVSFLEF